MALHTVVEGPNRALSTTTVALAAAVPSVWSAMRSWCGHRIENRSAYRKSGRSSIGAFNFYFPSWHSANEGNGNQACTAARAAQTSSQATNGRVPVGWLCACCRISSAQRVRSTHVVQRVIKCHQRFGSVNRCILQSCSALPVDW